MINPFRHFLACLLLLIATPGIAAELTIGARGEPALDPHYQWSDSNVAYYRHFYGGLTKVDERLRVEPDLALSWEAVTPTEWRFKLRTDAVFSDGTPVTARDVVASYKRMRTIKAVATFAGAVSGLQDVVAIDDHTVSMVFSKPNPIVPQRVSLVQILPAKLSDALSEDFSSGRAVVGFGPYKLVSYVPGQRIVMERNPRYFGEKGKWDKVTFRFISDANARAAALLSGEVDMIDAVPPNLVNRLRGEKDINVITGPSSRTILMTIDTSRDSTPFILDNAGKRMDVNPLKDKRVRQALNLAIDRHAISKRVMNGLSYPTGQVTPAGFVGYSADIATPTLDLAKAKSLLAEAGYPEGFRLTIHCTNDRHVEDANICQALGQMFTRLGLKMTVETLPAAIYTPRANDPKGDRFTMAMMGWSDGSGEALVLGFLLHTARDGYGTWNWGRHSDPELDKMIEDAVTDMDPKMRQAKLSKVMEKSMSDALLLPIHYQSVVVATRKGLGYNTWVTESTIADSVFKSP